jgi:tetratricopeptide (TPR) repeat protein
MRLTLISAVAPLVLLSACAGVGGRAMPVSAASVTGASTPYGMFLAGRAALNGGRNADAAQFFDEARGAGAGEAVVSEQAFTAALLSGDVERAAALAPTSADSSEGAKRLGKLVVAVETLAEGKNKEARALLANDSIVFPHKAAAALLQPWAAAGAGNVDASLVRPQVRGDRLVDYFGQLGQAALYERAKRYDEAETDFKAAIAANPSEMSILAYGGFLERRGRRVDAIALYQTYLSREPSNIAMMRARERAQAGRSAPATPTIREGAAQALLAPAGSLIAAKQIQIALGYLRLVLRLDPQSDEAWLMVGDILQVNRDMEAARAAYAHLKPGSPDFASAQAKLAWSYQAAGDKETALKLARAAAASGDADARITLADLLRSNEQWAESAQVLSGLIGETKTPDWRLLYARGVDYQALGRWPDAQADLLAALKDHPDVPELLNFLGYSWIDRGERLPEALAMVQKAAGSDPRSGAIVDSLGWAYFRMGDYKAAVEKLELAAELEAGDPEINDHLGDAYWRVGRKDEAQFQWRRVLTLKPEDKIRDRANLKLASGLGPDGPAPQVAGK